MLSGEIALRNNHYYYYYYYLYEILDDSGIAIRVSTRHFVEKIFLDNNGNFHTLEQQLIIG